MREGLASGVVQPKLVMDNVVEQLDAMLAEGVEGSSFMKPLTDVPGRVLSGRPGAAEGGLHPVDLDRNPSGARSPAQLHRD